MFSLNKHCNGSNFDVIGNSFHRKKIYLSTSLCFEIGFKGIFKNFVNRKQQWFVLEGFDKKILNLPKNHHHVFNLRKIIKEYRKF